MFYEWSGENLAQAFDDTCRDHADDGALIVDDRRLTYRELQHEVFQFAAGVGVHGVAQGSRVASIVDASEEFAVVTLAVHRLGAVLIPLNLTCRPTGINSKDRQMDFALSEEQQAMVAALRDVLKGHFEPRHFRQLEDNSEWPWEAMKALGDHGFVGILAPEELGGGGGTSLDAMLCLEEAARCMGGPAMAYFTTMCFGVRSLVEFGTPEQQEKILPGLIAGTSFVGLSLTEPDGGTDVLGAMRTRAERDDDGSWVINGAKVFTTGAHIADYVIAVVRTDDFENRGSYGITMFLVPTGSPGLTITPIPLFAQRTTGANNVVVDDVRVSGDMVLGEVNKGLYALFSILNDERIGAATMALGIAQAAFEEALEYAKTRTAFNRPIGQFQAVQHPLAEVWVKIQAVRQLVYHAAWLQTNKLPAEMESSGAKLLASETCIWVVNQCMDVLGGYSHTLEFNMSYYLRDGRYTFAPVTNNAVKNLIGERLGLPKSY